MSSTWASVADCAYKIFVFNPDTFQAAKQFSEGHYEWAWIVFMVAAVLVWNVRVWNVSGIEKENVPRSISRAVVEGIVHWSMSNAALFAAVAAHNFLYDHFEANLPTKSNLSSTSTDSNIRGVLMNALSKIHLVHNRVLSVPQRRAPFAPFVLMLIASLAALFSALFGLKLRTEPTFQ